MSRRQDLLDRERGSFLKKLTGRLPVALIYPNTYEVGMSSLGFQLVYSMLAARDDLVCERFFLPERGESLRSLESQRPLGHFSIVFFSVSFEHDYINLVHLLQQSGVAQLAVGRGDDIAAGRPLVVCGGVATFMNPEPLAPFIDLFVIGEAEPVLDRLLDALVGRHEQMRREELLHDLVVSIPGCYAPRFHTPECDERGRLLGYRPAPGCPERIKKVVATGCATAAHSQVVTPVAEFSSMHLTELGRGCSRGCRFCAAGFIYRPPRLWDAEAVVAGLKARLPGIDKVGLLGMEMVGATSLATISEYLSGSGCALSFSSLRADRLSDELIELLAVSNLKSVAIAPDGASERLRRVINKGLSETDLLDAARRLVEAGIFKLKLYLMIGLPTETDDDLHEAIELVKKIKTTIDAVGKARGRLTEIVLSVNCFTPKPWTPFQYHPFGMSEPLGVGRQGEAKKAVAELKRRQKALRQGLAGVANLHLLLDKPENVLFQAVLSRGDRRLAPVLSDIARTGCGWKQAMKRHHLTPEEYVIRDFERDAWFAWYIIDHGIAPTYFLREYHRALAGEATAPCDTRICRRCGVCHD